MPTGGATGPSGPPHLLEGSQAHLEPHAYWRGHRPILTPTPTGGVTGPSGPPHLLQGSQAHLDPHTFWRGHRPIWIPTPTAGVTGPGLQNLMGPLPRDPGAV